jgi:hypothetical protein
MPIWAPCPSRYVRTRFCATTTVPASTWSPSPAEQAGLPLSVPREEIRRRLDELLDAAD